MIWPGMVVGIGEGEGCGAGVGANVLPGKRCGATIVAIRFGASVGFGLGEGMMLHCGTWQQVSLGFVTMMQPSGTIG